MLSGIDLAVSDEVFRTEDPARIALTLWVFTFGALLATALEFIEFLIVARMSSLTLAVAGICKVRAFFCSRCRSEVTALYIHPLAFAFALRRRS